MTSVTFIERAFCGVMAAAIATAAAAEDNRMSLIETLAQEPEFAGFTNLLLTADAAKLLTGPGPFTVFVPTNEAIDAMSLRSDAALRATARAHITPARISRKDLVAMTEDRDVTVARTLEDVDIRAARVDDTVFVGLGADAPGVVILSGDIFASNGVIHTIDSVLIPMPEESITLRDTFAAEISEETRDRIAANYGTTPVSDREDNLE